MKKVNSHIEKEIDEIIHSGMKNHRVQTTPFFTTRVMGRVEHLDSNIFYLQRWSYIIKLAMLVVILVNVFNFFVYNQSSLLNESQRNQFDIVMDEYASAQNDFIISDELLMAN